MQSKIAYIGLGSNLDNPLQQCRTAIQSLSQMKDSTVLLVSPFYQSKALVANEGQSQPDYVNAVLALKTRFEPLELLKILQSIEAAQGRIRHHQDRQQRWQPRTLDLDILLFDQLIIDLPELKIPHLELHNRAFVMQPLYDIAPELDIPGRGRLAELRLACNNQTLQKLS